MIGSVTLTWWRLGAIDFAGAKRAIRKWLKLLPILEFPGSIREQWIMLISQLKNDLLTFDLATSFLALLNFTLDFHLFIMPSTNSIGIFFHPLVSFSYQFRIRRRSVFVRHDIFLLRN